MQQRTQTDDSYIFAAARVPSDLYRILPPRVLKVDLSLPPLLKCLAWVSGVNSVVWLGFRC